MFNSYVQLIQQHFSWLERKFPKIMNAGINNLLFLVKAIVVSPGIILLVFTPLAALMFGILYLPVSDNVHVIGMLLVFLVIFVNTARVAVKEIRK